MVVPRSFSSLQAKDCEVENRRSLAMKVVLQKGLWTSTAITHESDVNAWRCATDPSDALCEGVVLDPYVADLGDAVGEKVVSNAVVSDPPDTLREELVLYLVGSDLL